MAATVRDGPADKAGGQAGDVVLRFGDKAPPDERALMRMVAEAPKGEAATLTVWRAGQQQALPVTLVEWPRQLWEQHDAPSKLAPLRWTLPADFGLCWPILATRTMLNTDWPCIRTASW